MDRVNAVNLAMIRKAAQMTQAEVARKLGVGQGGDRGASRRGQAQAARTIPAGPVVIPVQAV
jgi:transcriptional regulator with XRE-family HTH domain